ncbi:unnamed protein product [Paramecium sonneborni]|uniref:MORN repeat protein n=1 Tax=Paramecium sonneborni TaxID=65129 RepID=A0A8S1RVM1_9CILI|nr:unnamed protein product [Paramecium sonneborni]
MVRSKGFGKIRSQTIRCKYQLNIVNRKVEIFDVGKYQNGFRIERWNFISENAKIGCGFYNKNGQKQGKWIELDKGFYNLKKVIYFGEYNMNGMK